MTIRPPAHIQWIVEAVGEDGALAFIESAAGQRISVPIKASGSRLERVYGTNIARALCARYPGEKYDVPTVRKWRIHRYGEMGMPVNDIAARAGVAVNAVYQALRQTYTGDRPARRVFTDDRQIPLF